MLDLLLIRSIAELFIETFNRTFVNPFTEYPAFANLLTDDAVISSIGERQYFTANTNPQTENTFSGTDTSLDDNIEDYFFTRLTRFFPDPTELYEVVSVVDDQESSNFRIALRVRTSGVGAQTGRFFEQPETIILEFDEDELLTFFAANPGIEDAIKGGTFDPSSEEFKFIQNIEIYGNDFARHIAVLDSPYQYTKISPSDPLTFAEPYNYDPSFSPEQQAEAIEIARQIWESLAIGDLWTPSTLHAEGAFWSFAATGPEYLPFVGTAQGYTFDGQPLGGATSAEEWIDRAYVQQDPTAFSNAGAILGNILAQLGTVVTPGDLQIVETYVNGNRVLVRLREGENTLPTALETGNPYQAPLDILSWFTIEDGKVTANEVIVNNYATSYALRPTVDSPFSVNLGSTRHEAPFFISGSRVNSGVYGYDKDGGFNGTFWEANAFDAPEMLLPIGITYDSSGTLYVNATLGGQDNSPIINAVLRFNGITGEYVDGSNATDENFNAISRELARDAVALNRLPRLQNVDPSRTVDNLADRDTYLEYLEGDPSVPPLNEAGEILYNDYNPALFGDAHGEFYDTFTGELVDKGSLVTVPFIPFEFAPTGLLPDALQTRPYDEINETLLTPLSIQAAGVDYVFADGDPTSIIGFGMPLSPLSSVLPVALLDLSNNGALLAYFGGDGYYSPGEDRTPGTEDDFLLYNYEKFVDPGNPDHIIIDFTSPETGDVAFNLDSLQDPRVVWADLDGDGNGDYIDADGDGEENDPLGVVVSGLVIPSGIKFGPDGNLYLPGAFSSRLLQYDGETGEFLSVFGQRENGVPVANVLNPALGLPPDFTVFVFGPDGGIYVSSVRTDVNPVTREPETETSYVGAFGPVFDSGEDDPRTNLFAENGYGAVLRFPGPTWDVDPDTGWWIDPLNGNLIEPGRPAGLAYGATDLSSQGVFGETGGIWDQGIQPLREGSAVAFGPDLNLYVASAQSGDVLVYGGPTLPDGTPNPEAGRYLGVYADVERDIEIATGRLEDPLALSGMGFGPDGNLYVGASFEISDPTAENFGAPLGGSQVVRYVGPSPDAFGQAGDPGDFIGFYGDVNTDISRVLLPTTPEFVRTSNTYTEYNKVTQRFPDLFFVVGVNVDRPFDEVNNVPGFYQDDGADVLAGFDRDFNFLGYLGTPLIDGNLQESITQEFLDSNPLSGIGGIEFGPNGLMAVSSQLTDEVHYYNILTGEYGGVFGDASAAASGLDFPAGIAFAPVNRSNTVPGDPGSNSGMFVSSLANGRILQYDGFNGVYGDDPATPEDEGILVQLPDEYFNAETGEYWRFTDMQIGPDGRLYVGLNSPFSSSEAGTGEVHVYNLNSTNQSAPEQIIGGFDFVAALTFGPDNRLYVSDDPASLVSPDFLPLLPDKQSSVSVYDIDYVYPLLTDAFGFGSPDGERLPPTLVERFEVGVGNAGGITVTKDATTDEIFIFLSRPVEANVGVYTINGLLLDELDLSLPELVLDQDADGLPRPTGSAFMSEFIRQSAYPILPEFPGGGSSIAVTGAGAGGGPQVRLNGDTDLSPLENFYAQDPRFTGGIDVDYADMDGDGIRDIITAAGPGGSPQVQVFSGVTGESILSFYAYDPNFSGGVRVAVGDVNGDGQLEIVTGARAGGGPQVGVWSVTFDEVTGIGSVSDAGSFYAYDPNFTGGVDVALADLDGRGGEEIITGAGPGGGPQVGRWAFSWDGGIGTGQASDLGSFYAYDSNFTGGVNVAAGDVNDDGVVDIITGAGAGGGPQVTVFRGDDRSEVLSFYAYDPRFTGGVDVAAVDQRHTGTQGEIITGAGPGGGPQVGIWEVFINSVAEVGSFYAYDPAFTGGVFVG